MAKSNIKVKKSYGQLQKDVVLFSFLEKRGSMESIHVDVKV